MMDKVLQIQNLYYSVEKVIIPLFKTERINILSDITFEIEDKEILGIAGESGSGKTTLAKLICGLLTKDSGEIILKLEQSKQSKTKPIQILFQNSSEILNPLRKVDDLISEAIKLTDDNPDEIQNEKKRILNSVDLSIDILNRRGFELSGGQQQRIALARLLAVKPKILILDEPFSSQDVESQTNFIKLFNKLNLSLGITIICISHNLLALKNICSRIIIMYKGKIVEQDTTINIFRNPQNSYTKFLLKASDYSLHPEDFDIIKK
jgi:ABC-type dipeptide/oligopeptide/nickel transport system ATPase subunit